MSSLLGVHEASESLMARINIISMTNIDLFDFLKGRKNRKITRRLSLPSSVRKNK